MKWLSKQLKNQSGFTLVEVLISIFILSIIISSASVAFVYATKTSRNNKLSMTAMNLANETIEYIRSLGFVEVGTIGGDPAGILQQSRTENIDGVNYKINTYINWEEEGNWDALGNANWDYKSVRVSVVPEDMEGNQVLTKEIESYVTRDSTQPPLRGGNIRLRLVRGSNTDVKIPNAKISLLLGPSAPRQVLTSSQGTARFFNLSPGNYQVHIDPSNIGMILRPDQVADWILSITNYVTHTKEFLVEYPCRLHITLKDLNGNPIIMNPGVTEKILIKDPYDTITTKYFNASQVDVNGCLPNEFISDLWPYDNSNTFAYSIPNITITGYLFFGSNEVKPTGETPWNGQFEGPGTSKNITCYFLAYPSTPINIYTSWVNGREEIISGSHVAEDEEDNILLPGKIESNHLSDTIEMPQYQTSIFKASTIYFENIGSSYNSGLYIDRRASLILNTDSVIIRGTVEIRNNRWTSNIGKITFQTLDDGNSTSVDGSLIGGLPGVRYGKLFLVKPVKLGGDTIVEPGGYYYYNGLTLPNNASQLIPITKNNYIE